MKYYLFAFLCLSTLNLQSQTFFGQPQVLDSADPYPNNGLGAKQLAIGQDDYPNLLLSSGIGLIVLKNNTDGSFSRQQLTTTRMINTVLVDWDGDNDQDILAALDSTILFFEQLADGSFATEQILTDQKGQDSYIDAEDIDADGDLDIYEYGGGTPSFLQWWENTDGAGTLAAVQSLVIFTDAEFGRPIINYNDFDNDGIKDFMVKRSSSFNHWAFVRGLGDGDFANPTFVGSIQNQVFSNSFPNYYDIDGDGDLDIVAGRDEYHQPEPLWWYEQENSFFSTAVPLPIDMVTSGSFNRGAIEDFTGDGILDLFGETTNDLKFVAQGSAGNIGFQNTSFLTPSSDLEEARLFFNRTEDIDQDGDLDIVFEYRPLSCQGGYNIVNIYWAENLDGQGTFAEINYLQTAADETFGVQGEIVLFIDLFNTGHPGLLKSFSGQILTWYPYQESQPHFDTEPVTLYQSLPPRAVCTADLDGDQDEDIIVGKDGQLAWYENLFPLQAFSERKILSSNSRVITSVIVDDWNGDGFLDIAYSESLGTRVVWLENLDGLGNFGSEQSLTNCSGGSTNVISLDVDQDQDADLFYSAQTEDGRLLWLENQNGLGDFNERYLEWEAPTTRVSGLHHFDMDNDGDQDVFSFDNDAAALVRVYENSGTALASENVLTTTGRMNLLTSGDLDGDGYEDLVYISFSSSSVFWCKNLNGDGTFEPAAQLAGGLSSLRYGTVTDLDNDGDLDIAVVLTNQNQVLWLENTDGLATFGEPQLISDQLVFSRSIAAADFDRDGDNDLVALGIGGNSEIVIYENLLGNQQISGYVYYDANQNATREANETGLQFNNLSLAPQALATYTGISGAYAYAVENGEYTVTASTPVNWQLTTATEDYTINVEDTIFADLNFGFYPEEIIYELRPTLTSAITRCNWEVPFWLNYENTGTTPVTGEVRLVLPTVVSPVFTDANQIAGDTLIWSIDNLPPTHNKTFYLTLQMPDVEAQGDLLTFQSLAFVQDEQGNTLAGEEHIYESVLLCAYDPNDKLVEPRGLEEEGYTLLGEELQYTIRFQNTGNDTAFTVRLEDQLDADLDWSSLRPVAASHDFTTTLNDQGLVTFLFENILLVDSTTNEVESHGFVTYRINPLPNSSVGTRVENSAAIFFDLNPPILTNTTLNTLVNELPTATEEILTDRKIGIFPNPSKDNFQLIVDLPSRGNAQLKIINMQGQLIQRQDVPDTGRLLINALNWPAGVYLLEVRDISGLLIGRKKMAKQ